MLEKGKISSFQMGVMMFPAITATAILTVPSITEENAQHDMWLSPIIASLIGYVSVLLAYQLHKLYPKLSVIEYSPKIIGRIPGKALGLLYVFFYVHVTSLIVRDYSDFIVGVFLYKTPLVFIAGSILIFSAFAVRGGVEVIARSSLIFTLLFITPIFLMPFLIPVLDVGNIFPVFVDGIGPAIKGAIVPAGWFSEFFLIAFFLPFLSNREKGFKSGMITVVLVTALLTYVNFFLLFLFGEDVSNILYPVLIAFRQISIGEFFENFEAVIMATWVVGNFVKISVFFYVSALGTGQLFGLSDYRPIVFPLGILIILLSYWGLPNVAVINHIIEKMDPFYLMAVQIVIPLFLLMIVLLRKRGNSQRSKGEATK